MRLILLVLLILGLCSCTKSQDPPPEDTALLGQIYTLMDSIRADAELMQTQLLKRYLSDEPTARFYVGANALSKSELLAALDEMYIPVTSQKLELIKQDAIVLAEDAVLYLAEMISIGTKSDGGTQRLALCESWLWKMEDGAWKVAHYHESW